MQTPEPIVPEPEAEEALARVVEMVKEDATAASARYLEETRVPEGGE